MQQQIHSTVPKEKKADTKDLTHQAEAIDSPVDELATSPKTAWHNSDETPGPSSTPTEAIARRAYELYRLRGGENGCALDDWLTAEQELKSDRE